MWSFYSRRNMYGFSITLLPVLLVSKMYSRIIDYSKKEQHNPAPAMLEWSCHISQCLVLSLFFWLLAEFIMCHSSGLFMKRLESCLKLLGGHVGILFITSQSQEISVFSRFLLRLVWEDTFLLRLCMLSFQFYLLKREQLLYTQCLEQEFRDWTSPKLLFL